MNDVMHFTYDPKMVGIAEVKVSKDDNVYGVVKAEVVRQYLKSAYSVEDKQADVEAFGKTYKVLKRDEVTTFYDADGNTLFDVENTRLQSEYDWLTKAGTAPKAEEDETSTSEDEQAEPVGGPTEEVKDEAAEEVVEYTEKEDGNSEVPAPVEEAPTDGSGADGEVFGEIEKAVAKIQSELEKASDKSFAEPVLNHIIERIRDSESLAKDVLQNHKTWDKCYQYIRDQARKVIKGSAGGVRDSVVYEWAEDYYHLDDKAAEEKKAKEAAERKKKAAEWKKKEEERKEKEKAKSGKKDHAKKPAPASNNQPVNAPIPVTETKPQHKPKKNEMNGQMDLFSMMGM